MRQVVAYKGSKTMKNYETVSPKVSRSRLQGVVVFQRFQPQLFDWENFDVLNGRVVGGHLWQVVPYKRWSHMKVWL